MWAVLDQGMEALMEQPGDQRLVGFCQGAAQALATFLNPYRPDFDEIRRVALLRWKYRHYESEIWQ